MNNKAETLVAPSPHSLIPSVSPEAVQEHTVETTKAGIEAGIGIYRLRFFWEHKTESDKPTNRDSLQKDKK